MLEMGTSGLMSGVGKRGDALAPAPASGLDSTDLPGILWRCSGALYLTPVAPKP